MIDAYGLGKVVASGNPLFEKDDYVVGVISWGEYSVSQGFFLHKLDAMGFPLSYHIGVLGNSISSFQTFQCTTFVATSYFGNTVQHCRLAAH